MDIPNRHPIKHHILGYNNEYVSGDGVCNEDSEDVYSRVW